MRDDDGRGLWGALWGAQSEGVGTGRGGLRGRPRAGRARPLDLPRSPSFRPASHSQRDAHLNTRLFSPPTPTHYLYTSYTGLQDVGERAGQLQGDPRDGAHAPHRLPLVVRLTSRSPTQIRS